MVYTVTFNPSLDYIVSVEDFQLGKTNRTAKEQMLPGGKGINVSTVLKNLGIPNTALGFSAGFTGEEIKRRGCSGTGRKYSQDHAGFHLQRYIEKAGGKRHPGSGRRHGRAFAPCSGVQTFPDQA